MKLFFNYSIDCETPRDDAFPNAAPTWAYADASTRGFVDLMDRLGMRDGASLFVYPDVAIEQASLYREMANVGIETALHLNGLRYAKLTGDAAMWLGAMTRDQQQAALASGKADLEDALGRPCDGYRACYGSANDDTFPLLEQLGFDWASNSAGRHRPEFHANWWGSWRYPHRASAKSKLIPGDLHLYEMPVTSGIRIVFDGNPDQPLDLRAESPPSLVGDRREQLRAVIEENIIEMARRQSPIRAIVGASHNTNPFSDAASHQAQNVEWVVRHTRELAAEHGLTFTPASFATIAREARAIGAY